ncbi:unnamed protein product [Acanthoscelides obtectus]|uniref:Uncharacterized protein n=1 Tax=Acanthoscelides obtectus TaxID=200917 RepID=A0A9P0Q3A7_ACAOB|nr:unnamed protein product [Acanthoscelides obtectus]CAK1642158.1 hypothetical protein AOBTE_LOCUS12856 [Acanthoscelides obtectus]
MLITYFARSEAWHVRSIKKYCNNRRLYSENRTSSCFLSTLLSNYVIFCVEKVQFNKKNKKLSKWLE